MYFSRRRYLDLFVFIHSYCTWGIATVGTSLEGSAREEGRFTIYSRRDLLQDERLRDSSVTHFSDLSVEVTSLGLHCKRRKTSSVCVTAASRRVRLSLRS